MSVKPYSSDRVHEPYSPPDLSITFGSAASAATARPTKNGVSEARKFGSCFAPSRQFAPVTPKWPSTDSVRM